MVAERRLSFPASFIQWILRKRIHLLLFKLHIKQQLEEWDYQASIEFAI